MKILLKSAKIFDTSSEHHLSVQDILISDGYIQKIAPNITETADEIISNCCVSEGWTDSSVCFGEPGYEQNETISNGMKVAQKSGFTQLMLNPNTFPVCDNRTGIEFLKNNSKNYISDIFPIGALTQNSDLEYLAELYDMHNAGAVAFGDYKKTIANANLLKIALQYTQNFGGIVISFANDKNIAGKGVVNEHFTSTRLGLKGIPSLAEELIIARDLSILEYTSGKLHIPTISSKKSVELIRKAKEKGLDVSCSVAVHHLYFSDEVLTDFNTNFKILPPLRNSEHQQALIEAVLDGTIDFITSDHCPIDIENKQREFDWADFGTIGLESAFGILNRILPVEKTIEMLTNAKKRFQLPSYSIREGQKANLTLFTTEGEKIFNKADIFSSSKNSAFIGETLKGEVLGIIVDDKISLN